MRSKIEDPIAHRSSCRFALSSNCWARIFVMLWSTTHLAEHKNHSWQQRCLRSAYVHGLTLRVNIRLVIYIASSL